MTCFHPTLFVLWICRCHIDQHVSHSDKLVSLLYGWSAWDLFLTSWLFSIWLSMYFGLTDVILINMCHTPTTLWVYSMAGALETFCLHHDFSPYDSLCILDSLMSYWSTCGILQLLHTNYLKLPRGVHGFIFFVVRFPTCVFHQDSSLLGRSTWYFLLMSCPFFLRLSLCFGLADITPQSLIYMCWSTCYSLLTS